MRKEEAISNEINFRKYILRRLKTIEKRIEKIEKFLFGKQT